MVVLHLRFFLISKFLEVQVVEELEEEVEGFPGDVENVLVRQDSF